MGEISSMSLEATRQETKIASGATSSASLLFDVMSADERGRPPAEAPAGRVTMKEAAELADVSYATVYRAVKAELVDAVQAENGEITIARADLRLIRRKPRAPRTIVPVMVRPSSKQWRRWKRAAGDTAVSAWLVQLADKAAKH